ncbi:hypothetical protein [Aquimarina macrocephali]|uniref:hypothetical protein n=1 Tax=Aquimarina macrocephali TaxID=666563 RepID=UPI00046309EB|nr:hypothetical protein [Aquimarina macrocephali]
MEYREFFQIEIIHPFFSDIPEDLVMVAENETKRHLDKRRFILKKTALGVKVLALFQEERNTFPVLSEDDIFTFYVYPTSDRISDIKDLSTIEKGNMISFTNQEQPIGSSELIATQIKQNGIFCGFPALAKIIIAGNKIKANVTKKSTKYTVIFKARSIRWKYYFVSNSEDSAITIESRNEQITFNEMVIDENTTDQIVTSLRLNFPDTRIKAFESRDLIPYSSNPIKNIKLIKNGDVLISHLPNPQKGQNGIQIIKIK